MEVVEADNGEDAIAHADTQGPFDIALLDVMLPTISGFEVCEALRGRYPRMGIIMLTAKSQEEDKIRGLELGADDYVQKPFSPGELIARIKSLYRRMTVDAPPSPTPEPQADQSEMTTPELAAEEAAVPQERLESAGSSGVEHAAEAVSSATAADAMLISGVIKLSIKERRLWKHEQEIILTPTEWTLVRLLMEREGESISRDHILSEVWGRYYVGDLKVVDVNIRRIRQKIEERPSNPSVIETVWGFGYRWKRSGTP